MLIFNNLSDVFRTVAKGLNEVYIGNDMSVGGGGMGVLIIYNYHMLQW